MKKNDKILIRKIKNNEKNIDLVLSTTMLLGSLGFLIVGFSSYINQNIIDFLNAKEIIFFPQGLTMCFYGLTGLLISSYQVRNKQHI